MYPQCEDPSTNPGRKVSLIADERSYCSAPVELLSPLANPKVDLPGNLSIDTEVDRTFPSIRIKGRWAKSQVKAILSKY